MKEGKCALLLADTRAFLVGLKCSLEVLESRERERKDRTLGQARKQFGKVHEGLIYGVELDSASLNAHQCACEVQNYVSRHDPHAFKTLRNHYTCHDPGASRGWYASCACSWRRNRCAA